MVHYSPDGRLVCLADGVGSWRKKGIDPSIYSNELCTRVIDGYLKRKEQILNPTENSDFPKSKKKKNKEVDLKELLIEAVKETKSRGSCTFTAVYFHLEKSVLCGVNFGDSGYAIIRNANTKPKLRFRTPKVEKETFNRPD